jgi:lysozyme family protein
MNRLPEDVREIVNEAASKIDPIRAVIALQGVLHRTSQLRVIDGVIRQETLDAIATTDPGDLIDRYVAHVEARFPGTFLASASGHDASVSGELTRSDPTPASTKTASRRNKRQRAPLTTENSNEE